MSTNYTCECIACCTCWDHEQQNLSCNSSSSTTSPSSDPPVEEFGSEVLLELLIDQGLDAVVAAVLLRGVQLETKASATLLNHTATHITGHDDQCVLEVHCTSLQQKESSWHRPSTPAADTAEHNVQDLLHCAELWPS